MKITAGLGRLKDYEALVDAGADELFAGFVPPDWLEAYGNFVPLNRREVLMQNIQLSSMEEMRLLARKIARRGVPVALTFNAICYLPMQYTHIFATLQSLWDLGFQDWIIADPALLLYLKENDAPGRIHLSGEAGCFGPDALNFFARFNLHRIIFPRKITPGEMALCIRAHPQYEYEAFALNERCHYSGAYCCSLHCDELEHICRLSYLPWGPHLPLQAAPLASDDFGAGGCALCAIAALREAGVSHLKVVGRGAHVGKMCRDIAILRRALALPRPTAEALHALLPDGRCSGQCYYESALT